MRDHEAGSVLSPEPARHMNVGDGHKLEQVSLEMSARVEAFLVESSRTQGREAVARRVREAMEVINEALGSYR
jgi:hypothetical protein